MQDATQLSQTSPRLFETLSCRECEILVLIVAGQNNTEIANTLHISRNTVKVHVRSILNKLGVEGRLQAAVAALRLGLL